MLMLVSEGQSRQHSQSFSILAATVGNLQDQVRQQKETLLTEQSGEQQGGEQILVLVIISNSQVVFWYGDYVPV